LAIRLDKVGSAQRNHPRTNRNITIAVKIVIIGPNIAIAIAFVETDLSSKARPLKRDREAREAIEPAARPD